MRILQTIFSIQDYGGIVNHVELLAKGFRELGHTCDVVILKCDTRGYRYKKPDTVVEGSYASEVGSVVNTISGWYGIPVLGYEGRAGMEAWTELSGKYDLVIHQLPVPKPDIGGWWKELYHQCDAPQIAIAHDAHFRDAYPHMIEIADRLVGVSVTNPAGYHALEHLPAPRVFIGAPHVPMDWAKQKSWKRRDKKFVSAHVWKAWKRMDWILRALPDLEGRVENVIGGDGIEGRYMRSKDKCKPRYRGLWKQAMGAGMSYVGLIPPNELMKIYEYSRAMVDMSYSDKFAALGNHFNRSTIEAYNGGCVPVCVHENMEDDTGIFVYDKHYLGIFSEDAKDPKRLAEFIHEAVSVDHSEIVGHGRELFRKHFDYRVSAQGFVDLARGKKKIGIYGKTETGKATKEVKDAAKKIIEQLEVKQ